MNKRRAPFAKWTPVSGVAGGPITGTARKITLHTTEGSGYPNWEAIRSIPHLTLDPATGQAWQHLDFDRSAYALGSPGTPRSPNMNAGINIQIEIIGRAAMTLFYSDVWYKRLALWLEWLCDEWQIPKDFPFPFGGENGYGTSGRYRQSWERFRDASGIVGHSNATYNSHWDPGNFDQKKLLSYMKGETIVAITLTGKQIDAIAEAAASRTNRTLGDYNAKGEPNENIDKPELASKKIRQIENKLDRVLAILKDKDEVDSQKS